MVMPPHYYQCNYNKSTVTLGLTGYIDAVIMVTFTGSHSQKTWIIFKDDTVQRSCFHGNPHIVKVIEFLEKDGLEMSLMLNPSDSLSGV